MILTYENGISLRGIQKTFPWSKLANSTFYCCVLLIGIMLMLSKECIGSLELTSRGPGYHFLKMDQMNSSRKLTNQCLVLSRNVTMEMCDIDDEKQRMRLLQSNELSLNFCNIYSPLLHVLAPSIREEIAKGDRKKCRERLYELMQNDTKVSMLYCTFLELINRVDCDQTSFSVKWNCTDCKEAYKKWLCSSEMAYFHVANSSMPLPPCEGHGDDFCSEVERRCPFIRPETNLRTYAGEPSFICKDQSIGDTISLSSSSHNMCYKERCRGSHCEFIVSPTRRRTTVVTVQTHNSSSNSTVNSSSAVKSYSVVWSVLYLVLYTWVARTCSQYRHIGLT